MTRTPTLSTRMGLLTILLIAHAGVFPLFSKHIYTPNTHPAINEPWRWTELEALSQISIFYTSEDSEGNLWLPNYQGITRYDGKELANYLYPPNYAESFPNGIIKASNGSVYIYTEMGIRMFKDDVWSEIYPFDVTMDLRRIRFAETNNGIVYVRSPDGLAMIRDADVQILPNTPSTILDLQIYEGSLWYTCIYSSSIFRVPINPDGTLSIADIKAYNVGPGEEIHRSVLLKTRSGDLITGNTSPNVGLLRFDHQEDRFIPYCNDSKFPKVHDVLEETSDGSIVIHTTHTILVLQNEKWYELSHADYEIPTNFPFIYATSDHSLLIGGFRESIYKIDTSNDHWSYYSGLNYQCEDLFNRSWFLSVEGEVIVHDPSNESWIAYDQEDGIINTPDLIQCTKNGFIWVIGSDDATAAFSTYRDGVWKTYRHPEMGGLLSPFAFFEAADGEILMGCGDPRGNQREGIGGILRCKPHLGSYEFETSHPPTVATSIDGLVKTPTGEIWMGGEKICYYSPTGTAPPELPEDTLWTHNWILDSKGVLMCSQWGHGILRYENQTWSSIDNTTGLSSNMVVTIAEDILAPGNLYALSPSGVSYFDGTVWTPSIFSVPFKLKKLGGTLKQSLDGSVWINSTTRVWNFRYLKNSDDSELDASRFNCIRRSPRELTPETTISSEIERMTYPGNISVSWSAFTDWSYTPSSKMMFSYQIDNGNWSNYTTQQQKTFLSLPIGHHTIRVRAKDLDRNTDPTPAEISIVVVPPLWRRPVFIISIAATIILIVMLITIIIRQRIRSLIAMEEFKLAFFTNISHELRTPLTVILGPIESVLEKVKDESITRKLLMAEKAAKKMLKLVDQLLEFRKVELGKHQHHFVQFELISFIREEISLISPLTSEKHQQLLLHSTLKSAEVTTDADKLSVILSNLISNAVKYTQEGGEIIIELSFHSIQTKGTSQQCLALSVKDNGPGISAEKQNYIFSPFYRGNDRHTIEAKGTGLGLALTHHLVESLNGSIKVESPTIEKTHGTSFHLQIPVQVASLHGDSNEKSSVLETPEIETQKTGEISIPSGKNLILVAEDSEDILDFLTDELKQDFIIETSPNGRIAFEKAKSIIPDIILTDVLMPEMDGRELCAKIKADELTSHIPVVMLTALKSDENELIGLQAGADAYVTKPVKISNLRKQISNILHLRDEYQRKFKGKQGDPTQLEEKDFRSQADERYLKRINKVIYDHLDDYSFNVDQFAEALSMSKMTLTRKLNAITGQSPATYVRNTRLNEAALLLKQGKYQVSEVIQYVGFQDLSHFGAAFKKHFGCTPSQYAMEYKD